MAPQDRCTRRDRVPRQAALRRRTDPASRHRWSSPRAGGRRRCLRQRHQVPPSLPGYGTGTKQRWMIKLHYEELKQELRLGRYEGRGWRGFHHHAKVCITAYRFLITERSRFPPRSALDSSKGGALCLPSRAVRYGPWVGQFAVARFRVAPNKNPGVFVSCIVRLPMQQNGSANTGLFLNALRPDK